MSKYGYMPVGRNMGYTKNVFDLIAFPLMKKSRLEMMIYLFKKPSQKPTSLLIMSQKLLFLKSTTIMKSWLKQKNRHHSSSHKYKVINKALLGIYPLSLILMWFSFVSLFCEVEYRAFGLSLFCFVLIVKWIIQGLGLKKIKENSFILLFPFLELIQNMIMIVFFSLKVLNKKNKW